MSANLRSYLSSYWHRRLVNSSVLHIDVFAYQYLNAQAIILEYRISAGGKQAIRSVYFVVTLDGWQYSEPKQLQPNSLLLTDIALLDPVRMNASGRDMRLAAHWRELHHKYLRDIAAKYPLDGFKLRSVRFWYFVNPDHNPTQGFANWYVAPRSSYARPMPNVPA